MNKLKRIKSNSENLKKHFPGVYRDFFSKNSIVTSASGSFNFIGDQGSSEGGLNIIQKIPLKSYIGLELIEAGHIEEGEVLFYDSALRKFEQETYFDESNFSDLKKVILAELKKIDSQKGYRINILCEMSTKCGVNSSGSVASSLAAAILLDNKIIKTEEIENFKNLNFQHLKEDKNFNLVFHLARKIHAVMHAGKSAGSGVFGAMAHNNFPIIYFLEKNSDCHFKKQDFENDDRSQNVKFYAYRLQALFGIDENIVWPFDFGLIYTGHAKSSNIASRIKDSVKSSFADIAQGNREIFKDKFASSDIDKISFLEAGDDINDYWHTIMKLSSHISMECLHSLHQLFDGKIDNFTLSTFFKTISRYYNIFQFLNLTNSSMNRVRSAILGKASTIDENLGGGVKALGGGLGGDLLFVIPRGHFTTATINELTEKLNIKLQRNDIGIDYASWIDGTDSKGLEVQQCLEAKKYSEFVSRGSIVLENIEKDKRFTEVISKQELAGRMAGMEILVDNVNGFLYLGGKKIKSDEIPSAVTASMILVKLLDSNTQEIGSRELEVSSYAEDRNIFQSKIVTPLVKAVKKYCKKELNFKLSGKITDFKIKIDFDDLRIGVVRKMI